MDSIEFTCAILGMPLLIIIVYLCIEYERFMVLLAVLIILGVSVPMYFFLSQYEVTEEKDEIHVRQNCDFQHKLEQVGDSIVLLTICDMINLYENDKYQPRTVIRVLYMKDGNKAVYSQRRCLIWETPYIDIFQFKDEENYMTDLLKYVNSSGDTLYLDTYEYKTVNLNTYRIPKYYIDPTIYLY